MATITASVGELRVTQAASPTIVSMTALPTFFRFALLPDPTNCFEK
jgi:hypothetical protein